MVRTARFLLGAAILVMVLLGLDPLLRGLADEPCPARSVPGAQGFPSSPAFSSLGQAEAIPALARKWNMSCSTCHTAFPFLNETGRAIKEAGFRLPDEDGSVDPAMQGHQVLGPALALERALPLAARLTAAPFALAKDGDVQLRSFEALSLQAFGSWGAEGSARVVIDMESEADFAPGVHAALGYHPSRSLNALIGYGSPFTSDPYNTLVPGGHGLTRAGMPILAESGPSGISLTGNTPFASLYGRAGGLYWMAGAQAPTGSKTGALPTIGLARVALDLGGSLSFGLFGQAGVAELGAGASDHAHGGEAEAEEEAHVDPPGAEPHDDGAEAAASDLTLWRAGLDATLTAGDLTLYGLLASVGDSDDEGGKETTLGGYLQLLYTMREGGRPLFAPLLRLDWLEGEEGQDDSLVLVANASSWAWENLRVGGEASYALSGSEGSASDWRTALFLDLGF